MADDKTEEKKVAKKKGKGFAHNLWKFFGSMIMDKKGKAYALSLTRVMAVILFVVMIYQWLFTGQADPALMKILEQSGVDASGTLDQLGKVPDQLLHTFWALLGIKGVNTLADGIKKKLGVKDDD